MKRKSAFLSFTACALMAASHPVKAAVAKSPAPPVAKTAEQADFSKVEVVPLQGGAQVALFDRATGTFYIYDSSLTKCVGIRKLNTLGETAVSIQT
jgi:hypothetical protein